MIWLYIFIWFHMLLIPVPLRWQDAPLKDLTIRPDAVRLEE